MRRRAGAHCPTCGAEYRAGFETCADDGTPLVPGPAPEPVPEPEQAPEPEPTPEPDAPIGRWVPVADFSEPETARLLAGRLESEGIEARVFPEDFSSSYRPVSAQLWGQPIRVFVPENRITDSQELIRAIEQG